MTPVPVLLVVAVLVIVMHYRNRVRYHRRPWQTAPIQDTPDAVIRLVLGQSDVAENFEQSAHSVQGLQPRPRAASA